MVYSLSLFTFLFQLRTEKDYMSAMQTGAFFWIVTANALLLSHFPTVFAIFVPVITCTSISSSILLLTMYGLLFLSFSLSSNAGLTKTMQAVVFLSSYGKCHSSLSLFHIAFAVLVLSIAYTSICPSFLLPVCSLSLVFSSNTGLTKTTCQQCKLAVSTVRTSHHMSLYIWNKRPSKK